MSLTTEHNWDRRSRDGEDGAQPGWEERGGEDGAQPGVGGGREDEAGGPGPGGSGGDSRKPPCIRITQSHTSQSPRPHRPCAEM